MLPLHRVTQSQARPARRVMANVTFAALVEQVRGCKENCNEQLVMYTSQVFTT